MYDVVRKLPDDVPDTATFERWVTEAAR